MNTVWILVCDAARGRLFEIHGDDPVWRVIDVLVHPESRSQSNGGANGHSAQEVEKGHFAHTLATMLDQAVRSKRFQKCVLVAPPHFLGMLKKELTPELAKHTMATVDKDLTHVEVHELVEKLRDVVRIPNDQRDVVRQTEKHAH